MSNSLATFVYHGNNKSHFDKMTMSALHTRPICLVGFYDSMLHVYVPFEVDLFLYVISILLLTQSYHHTKI